MIIWVIIWMIIRKMPRLAEPSVNMIIRMIMMMLAEKVMTMESEILWKLDGNENGGCAVRELRTDMGCNAGAVWRFFLKFS